MGGITSGRTGGSAVVEDGLRLDMAHLNRSQLIRPGHRLVSTLDWRSSGTGRLMATIVIAADLRDLAAASVRLLYTVTRDGSPVHHDCRVDLEAAEPRYGGLRWWFICPLTDRRVRVLCLPPEGTVFASRHAFGLGYRSQRQTAADRAIARARAVRENSD